VYKESRFCCSYRPFKTVEEEEVERRIRGRDLRMERTARSRQRPVVRRSRVEPRLQVYREFNCLISVGYFKYASSPLIHILKMKLDKRDNSGGMFCLM
jgi:hypothetical protein